MSASSESQARTQSPEPPAAGEVPWEGLWALLSSDAREGLRIAAAMAFLDLGQKEAATMLGLTPFTACHRLRALRRELRAILEPADA